MVVVPREKKFPRLFLFILLGFLAVSASGIVSYLIYIRHPLVSRFMSPAPSKQSTYMPVPTGVIREDTSLEYANHPLMQPPSLPSAEELDRIYGGVISAIESRDYNKFKKVAASGVIWDTEHESVPIGETADASNIDRLVDISGEENFKRRALYSILLRSPPHEDIEAVSVEWIKPSGGDRRTSYYMNEKTNEVIKIKSFEWQYKVSLNFRTTEPYPHIGNGKVYFVYDNDHWAYDLEDWKISIGKNSRETGDEIPPHTKVHSVSLNKKTGRCVPEKIKINHGEAIRWEKIEGKIYSIPPSSGYWQSEYLRNETFVKAFETPGEHSYFIAGPHLPDYKFPECYIEVN